MPSDPALSKHMLTVLARYPVKSTGMPEASLFAETETQCGRPLTTQACRDCAVNLIDLGWATSTQDDFQQTRYSITACGRNRLRSL